MSIISTKSPAPYRTPRYHLFGTVYRSRPPQFLGACEEVLKAAGGKGDAYPEPVSADTGNWFGQVRADAAPRAGSALSHDSANGILPEQQERIRAGETIPW